MSGVQLQPRGTAQDEAEWCDRHLGYVPAGQTEPAYGPRSPYRRCLECKAKDLAAVEAREAIHEPCGYGMAFHIDGRCPQELGPNGARAQAGDR